MGAREVSEGMIQMALTHEKRILGIFLAIALSIGLLPTSVFAMPADERADDKGIVSIDGSTDEVGATDGSSTGDRPSSDEGPSLQGGEWPRTFAEQADAPSFPSAIDSSPAATEQGSRSAVSGQGVEPMYLQTYKYNYTFTKVTDLSQIMNLAEGVKEFATNSAPGPYFMITTPGSTPMALTYPVAEDEQPTYENDITSRAGVSIPDVYAAGYSNDDTTLELSTNVDPLNCDFVFYSKFTDTTADLGQYGDDYPYNMYDVVYTYPKGTSVFENNLSLTTVGQGSNTRNTVLRNNDNRITITEGIQDDTWNIYFNYQKEWAGPTPPPNGTFNYLDYSDGDYVCTTLYSTGNRTNTMDFELWVLSTCYIEDTPEPELESYVRTEDVMHLAYFDGAAGDYSDIGTSPFVMTIPDMSQATVQGESVSIPESAYDTYMIANPYQGVTDVTDWTPAVNTEDAGKNFYMPPDQKGKTIQVGSNNDVTYGVEYASTFTVVNYSDPSYYSSNNSSWCIYPGITTWQGDGNANHGSRNYGFWQPYRLGSTNPRRQVPFEEAIGQNSGQTIRFQYMDLDGDGTNEIYLRGVGDSEYLGWSDELGYVCCYWSPSNPGIGQGSNGDVYGYDSDGGWGVIGDGAVPIPINLYEYSEGPATTVEFLAPQNQYGAPVATTTTAGYLNLPQLEDVWMLNGQIVPSGTPGATIYSLLGWSTTKPSSPYLSVDESTNLYDTHDQTSTSIFDYGQVVGYSSYKDEVADRYDLVGTGNPDGIDTVNANSIWPASTSDRTETLYAIYAVRGFNTVVTADEEDGTPVLGVSDWKPNQGETGYNSPDREKWLGSIDVNVYIDGDEDPWVSTQRLYFMYHNDDAVDLSIKFIWDELLAQYGTSWPSGSDQVPVSPDDGSTIQMYQYLSDEGQFPGYDQIEHFVIDGVYATQGDSEDGLVYAYNWVKEYGGQLDNVIGGSTVDIYVTTIYNQRYYLDDELIESAPWYPGGEEPSIAAEAVDGSELEPYFATPGTETAFDPIWDAADYSVTDENQYADLMNGDQPLYEPGEEGNYPDGLNTFNPNDAFSRGEAFTFGYFIHDYETTMPIMMSPEQLVPDGSYLVSEDWLMKGNGNQTNLPWSSTYPLEGTTYNTGNTIYAYPEEDYEYAGTDPYTFHLYAYTDKYVPPTESGSLTLTKLVEGDTDGLPTEFTFTITLGDDTLTGEYGDVYFEEGVGQVTLKAGETVTLDGLPAGVTYQVEEETPEGYTASWTQGEGTIAAGTTIEAQCVNSGSGEVGALAVVKRVEGANGPIGDEFEFTLTLDDESIDGQYGEMTFEKGVATFTLKDRGSIVATGLPIGTKYAIEEQGIEGYVAKWSKESEEVEGQTTENLTCTNTVVASPLTPVGTTTGKGASKIASTGDDATSAAIMLLVVAIAGAFALLARRRLARGRA